MNKFLLILPLIIACSTKTIPYKKPVIVEPAPVIIESGQENKVFYKVESTLQWVADAAKIADCVTVNKDFHKEILSVEKYEHYSGTNNLIVKSLLSAELAVVGTYYKKYSVWPKLTKTRAYRNVGSNKIYLNTAKINKADADLINTMIHERLHVLEYGHVGNNKYKFNNVESVNYKVGKLSEKYFDSCLK